MKRRIDQIVPLPLKTQYGGLTYFIERLDEAFKTVGIDSKIIEWDANDETNVVKELSERKPDWTVSFNCIPFVHHKELLCDVLKIPHVTILIDAPYFFMESAMSPYLVMTCFERSSIEFYRRMGFDDIFFFPHAADGTIVYEPSDMRPYDVTMLATCIDYKAIKEEWASKYTPTVQKLMDRAILICLKDKNVTCYQAFNYALGEWESRSGVVDPETIHLPKILSDVDMYIRGKHRVDMLRSIKSAQVHVFGRVVKGHEWTKYLGDLPNFTIHGEVMMKDTVDIMKQSKIVLNSTPTIRGGVHERILTALACGAVVISNDDDYINEEFKGTDAVVTFKNPSDLMIDETVVEYLKNPVKRAEAAVKGREIVMQRHTWEHRVRQLLDEIPRVMEERQRHKLMP